MLMTRAEQARDERLYQLKPHPEQSRLWSADSRFNVVPAGRRSGKTEICGKRRLVIRSLIGNGTKNPKYFAAAPTIPQARKIFWDDLKILTRPYWRTKPNETRLEIYMYNSEIHVLGMDRPERVEGIAWAGGILDEYGNMKENAWTEHVMPALSTPGMPLGWCDFIGVPEGRNHYYDLYKKAKAYRQEFGPGLEWDTFHWISADILAPEAIAQAKRDLDELTYQQEYEGSFISFYGRAYYNFTEDNNCAKLTYNPDRPISFTFDFNVDPGTANVIQEQNCVDPKTNVPLVNKYASGVIGEVYIPRNSNTIRVCNKLIQDWKDHNNYIFIYGDTTGGSRGSAKVRGSDWDLVKATLLPVFGDRLIWRVPRRNPLERSRINAMNSRCMSLAGDVKLQVDPKRCPQTVRDFEGVGLLVGGSGEIDKKKDLSLSHLTDGIGYYINKEFPIIKGRTGMVGVVGT